MFFLTSMALASIWSAEIAVPSTHYFGGPEALNGAERVLAYVEELPDTTVSSSHPLVTCRSEKGYVIASMEANASEYPTKFPFEASCSLLEHELALTIVEMPPDTDFARQSYVIDTDRTVHIKRPGKAAILRPYRLPDLGVRFVQHKQVSAVGLDGVFCKVTTTEDLSTVSVLTSTVAELGSGLCALPLENGETFELTIDLTEGPF